MGDMRLLRGIDDEFAKKVVNAPEQFGAIGHRARAVIAFAALIATGSLFNAGTGRRGIPPVWKPIAMHVAMIGSHAVKVFIDLGMLRRAFLEDVATDEG